MTKKFRGNPVYWESENGRGIITFNQFALGCKYSLYIKKEESFEYNYSENSLGKLIEYAKMNYFVSKAE